MIESAAESFDEVTLPTVIRTLGTQRRTHWVRGREESQLGKPS